MVTWPDSTGDHEKWSKDIEETQGYAPNYPLIGDTDLKIAKLYDMLPASAPGEAKGRTAMDNATVRTVFVVGPDKKIKLMLTYPMSTGRNFDEVLRVLDSIQLTAKHKVATPVNSPADGNRRSPIYASSRNRAEARCDCAAGAEKALLYRWPVPVIVGSRGGP